MKNNKPVLLWLDDLRNPFLDYEQKVPSDMGTIIWVLNYTQFVDYINKHGLPDVVSFDHDLAEEHYMPPKNWNDYQASKEYQDKKYLLFKEKTGYDCARWLLDYCHNNRVELPTIHVHSANPVGADKIRDCIRQYDPGNT